MGGTAGTKFLHISGKGVFSALSYFRKNVLRGLNVWNIAYDVQMQTEGSNNAAHVPILRMLHHMGEIISNIYTLVYTLICASPLTLFLRQLFVSSDLLPFYPNFLRLCRSARISRWRCSRILCYTSGMSHKSPSTWKAQTLQSVWVQWMPVIRRLCKLKDVSKS